MKTAQTILGLIYLGLALAAMGYSFYQLVADGIREWRGDARR